MIPTAFAYDRPASLDEALGLLAVHGPDTKVLAGGQSLLPLLKMRLAHADRLVDIGRIAELRGVRRLADGGLAIGALTTYEELMASDAGQYAVLADALPEIGDVQVRNRGTVGGAIVHADPSSDLPACLLALGAGVVLRSSRGARTVPADGFFAGPFQSGIEPDELLTEIRLPAPRADRRQRLRLPLPAGVRVLDGRGRRRGRPGRQCRHRHHGGRRAPVSSRGGRVRAGRRRHARSGGSARRRWDHGGR